MDVIGLGLYRMTSYCITDVGIFGSAVIVIPETTDNGQPCAALCVM